MKRKAIRRLTNPSNRIKKSNKKIKKQKDLEQIPSQKGWDVKKSQKDNFEKLGIYTNINKRVTDVVDKNSLIQAKKDGLLLPEFDKFIDIDEEIDLKDIKSVLEKNKLPEDKYVKQKPGKITIDEEWAIEKIVAKHNTNFNKAQNDHKTNEFMWTADQIKRKHTSYIEKHGKCPKN